MMPVHLKHNYILYNWTNRLLTCYTKLNEMDEGIRMCTKVSFMIKSFNKTISKEKLY